MHKSIGEHDVTYGRFENIQVSNIPSNSMAFP